MRKLLLTTTALVALSGGTAIAADLPSKVAPVVAPIPYANWTGPWVAGLVGGARMNATATNTGSSNFGNPCGHYNAACSTSATGAVAGVEVGYDWQDRSFVYGVAADWTWTGLKRTNSRASGLSVFTHQAKIDWLASFRGRMGLAVDNTLVYLTGGVALGEVKSYTQRCDANAGCLNYGALSETKVGWVAGGGVEHKFNRNWAFKGEALYYDLGRSSATGTPCAGCQVGTDFTHEVIVGRVGLVYRWW